MESLVFSLRLRVARLAVHRCHVHLHHPDFKRRIAAVVVCPGCAVVAQNRVWNSEFLENAVQTGLCALPSFVFLRVEAQGKPRVIVQNRQSVAALAVRHAEVALVIHLPQRVRPVTREAFPRRVLLRGQLADAPIPFEDVANGAGCRNGIFTLVHQKTLDFPSAPRWMCGPHIHDPQLHIRTGFERLPERRVRPVEHRLAAFVPLEPLVAGWTADAVFAAQRAQAFFSHRGPRHKFASLIVHSFSLPRH